MTLLSLSCVSEPGYAIGLGLEDPVSSVSVVESVVDGAALVEPFGSDSIESSGRVRSEIDQRVTITTTF